MCDCEGKDISDKEMWDWLDNNHFEVTVNSESELILTTIYGQMRGRSLRQMVQQILILEKQ